MSNVTKRELEEELENLRTRMEDVHAIMSDALGYEEDDDESPDDDLDDVE